MYQVARLLLLVHCTDDGIVSFRVKSILEISRARAPKACTHWGRFLEELHACAAGDA